MEYIIEYNSFKNKSFQFLSIDDYTNMVRRSDIACFDSNDIKRISSFLEKNDLIYRFGDATLIPINTVWSIFDDKDIDIDIEERFINLHLTDGTLKKLDLNDYLGLSYDEVDKLPEFTENNLKNFTLIISKNLSTIEILKCYEEYYIVDIFRGETYLAYHCDQLDGLFECIKEYYNI